MSIIQPIKAIAGSISGVMGSLDELITSKEERMEKDNELAQIRNDLAGIQRDIYTKAAEVETNLIVARKSVLEKETSGSKLQRSWRPLLMLTFGAIIVYQFFIVHLINAILTMFQVEYQGDILLVPEFPLPDRFWVLLEIGIGGYIAGRSLEKIVPNVSEKIMEARESKRITDEIQIKQENRTRRMEMREERKNRILERKEERRLKREERREDRMEDHKEILEIKSAGLEPESVKLTRKQKRQEKRRERRQRNRSIIESLTI